MEATARTGEAVHESRRLSPISRLLARWRPQGHHLVDPHPDGAFSRTIFVLQGRPLDPLIGDNLK
jgi:hypothetical protein